MFNLKNETFVTLKIRGEISFSDLVHNFERDCPRKYLIMWCWWHHLVNKKQIKEQEITVLRVFVIKLQKSAVVNVIILLAMRWVIMAGMYLAFWYNQPCWCCILKYLGDVSLHRNRYKITFSKLFPKKLIWINDYLLEIFVFRRQKKDPKLGSFYLS